jgi:transposase
MTNFKEILRLHSLGINNTQIAESCGCSRPTAIRTVRKAKEIGLTYERASEMSDRELFELLTPGEKTAPAYRMPDYDYIHKEMAKSGVTLSLLWMEYCEACKAEGTVPYKSTQFGKYYADYVKKTKATMHIRHKPGDLMETDWAGQTAEIVDTDTGGTIDAYLFVAVLPYSGYAYAEPFLSQSRDCWIAAHVNAYRHFGGATRILRPDNTKTAVISNTRDELVLNKAYREMAEHYGTAVIPARVRKPKDKASVEGTVGVASTWILAALRNERFFSLAELSEAVGEKLLAFNGKPFQKKDGSRFDVYAEEKPFLIPLPKHHFELSDWKTLTVGPNYHISCDMQNYSAPFEYIGRKLDVRLTKNTVEMFFEGNRVCSHVRLYGRSGQYSTADAHMPPKHRHALWDGDRFRRWAAKIGPNALAAVEVFLAGHKVEQQGYKSCNALLHLTDKYSAERLEAACAKALSYTPRPSLKSVQMILKSGQDQIAAKPYSSQGDSPHGLTRGAGYYGGADDAE